MIEVASLDARIRASDPNNKSPTSLHKHVVGSGDSFKESPHSSRCRVRCAWRTNCAVVCLSVGQEAEGDTQ